MQITEYQDLTPYNTFRVSAKARYFVLVEKQDELTGLIDFSKKTGKPLLLIGQGSNVLFVNDPDFVVAKLLFDDIKITEKTQDTTLITVQAGAVWDDVVWFTVKNNLYGAVNLSFIPGTAGAAPVQNIGAYGTELSDIVHSVSFFDTETKTIKTLSKQECEFGYRTSIFKTRLKGKAIITGITLKLNNRPEFNLNYKDLAPLAQSAHLSLTLLRLTIGKIRRKKLPDPSVIGNAGSFFKNPIINKDQARKLRQRFRNMPQYPAGNSVKIPAGWLIDNLGLKGYRMGDAGVYEHNALVLVNYGNATGKDILKLADHIRQKVLETYGILLEPEVNII